MPRATTYKDNFVFNEDDQGVKLTELERASRHCLRFGKYRGRAIGNMIKRKVERNYLRYLLTWDLLRTSTRDVITLVVDNYDRD
jgi:hypothetical protein